MGSMAKLILFALLSAFILVFGCASSPLHEGVAADGRPYRGAATPKLTIYEYSDFECPYCQGAEQTVGQVLQSYQDTVRLEYRYYPLTDIHPRAYASAIAGECAEQQGKFWAMHDLMFANQNNLEDADLVKYATQAGLDIAAFNKCVSSPAAAKAVDADQAAGQNLGIRGTPTFFIGQSELVGNQPISKFKEVIDSELARAG